MHFHIFTSDYDSQRVISEARLENGPESIHKFLNLAEFFFRDSIVSDKVVTEQQMYGMLEGNGDAVLIGMPPIVLGWATCQDPCRSPTMN